MSCASTHLHDARPHSTPVCPSDSSSSRACMHTNRGHASPFASVYKSVHCARVKRTNLGSCAGPIRTPAPRARAALDGSRARRDCEGTQNANAHGLRRASHRDRHIGDALSSCSKTHARAILVPRGEPLEARGARPHVILPPSCPGTHRGGPRVSATLGMCVPTCDNSPPTRAPTLRRLALIVRLAAVGSTIRTAAGGERKARRPSWPTESEGRGLRSAEVPGADTP